MSFSLTDLFLLGLGFDITGAVLLARGLLIGPDAIAKLNTYHGLERGDTIDRCRNWCYAAFGVSCLVAGFLAQAAGYESELSGADPASGPCRALTGAFLGIVAIAIASALWQMVKGRMLKHVIVRVALAKFDEKDRGWTRSKAIRLMDLGEEAGWPPTAAELEDGGSRDYAKRVFRIEMPGDIYSPSSGSPDSTAPS